MHIVSDVKGKLAPGMTAGVLSREREGQTLEMLLLTRMSDNQLVWGKLLSGLTLLWIALLCALPALGVGFMLGGVAGKELLGTLALLVAVALCFGAVGLWCSARFRRTAVAVTVAYLLCAVILFATPVFTGILLNLASENLADSLLWFIPVIIGAGVGATLLTNYIASRLRAVPPVRLLLLWGLLATVLLALSAGVWYYAPPAQTQHFQDYWDEYIEYADPLLAFDILQDPVNEVGYELFFFGFSIVANYEEDWPIIPSVITEFILIALIALSFTRRELRRMRGQRLLRA
jgi:hypothetical protein